ncbi:hypothetical protein SAMN06265375_10162 [Muriicola jejuensis]|nr:hypothetical protein SAMN06265375_10162 [Muriicola jejuensis]
MYFLMSTLMNKLIRPYGLTLGMRLINSAFCQFCTLIDITRGPFSAIPWNEYGESNSVSEGGNMNLQVNINSRVIAVRSQRGLQNTSLYHFRFICAYPVLFSIFQADLNGMRSPDRVDPHARPEPFSDAMAIIPGIPYDLY